MKTITKVSNVDQLIAEVSNNELTKVNLNDLELLEKVIENYSKVSTKSAMLKLIRKDNFKVSQDRCYTTYLRYQRSLKQDTKSES